MPFPVHPHMLRHAAGYKLANEGQTPASVQHYLGHKNIQHTVRYTELIARSVQGFLARLNARTNRTSALPSTSAQRF